MDFKRPIKYISFSIEVFFKFKNCIKFFVIITYYCTYKTRIDIRKKIDRNYREIILTLVFFY